MVRHVEEGMSLGTLYDGWFAALLGPVPREPLSTCRECPMCEGAGLTFDPASKCCTYQPRMANYLVGGLLCDDSSEHVEGRAQVMTRIRERRWISPLALERSPLPALAYDRFQRRREPGFFGRSQALRCPLFNSEHGNCGVWQHRESMCATWFCKHVRGATGYYFWQRVRAFLAEAEQAVSRWCLLELGFSAEALDALVPPSERALTPTPDLDGRVDEGAHARHWGEWVGREHELYLKTNSLVRELSPERLLAVGGARLQVRMAVLESAYRRVNEVRLPGKVRCGQLVLQPQPGSVIRVGTYSPYDPLELPVSIVDAIRAGGVLSTPELLNQPGIDLNVVRILLDFGLLITVE